MSTPALPLLTKWSCADTCITAYDGFCERFTYTGIWPATAQCLLTFCSDRDRIAVQDSVAKYCDAIGYPDVWGPYIWGLPDDDDDTTLSRTSTSSSPSSFTKTTPTPSSSSFFSVTSSTLQPAASSASPAFQDGFASASSAASGQPSGTTLTDNSQAEGSGLSTGAKAGIGIGAVFGFIALAILAVFLLRWRKKQREANFPEGPDHFATPTSSPTEKVFDGDEIISYTIEGGTLKRSEKRPPTLSIKIV